MEVDATGLIRILKRIQKRLHTFDEYFALDCAIAAVKELDRIQLKSDLSKKEAK